MEKIKAIARMALEMQQEITKFNIEHNAQLNIRISVNAGSAIAFDLESRGAIEIQGKGTMNTY